MAREHFKHFKLKSYFVFQSRPLSWASPGNFTIHDKVEMDWLVADLGSLSHLDSVSTTHVAAKTPLTTVGELCTAAS
jgi:hypothetical protein